MPSRPSRRRFALPSYWSTVLFAPMLVAYLVTIALLFHSSIQYSGGVRAVLDTIVRWIDPIFFQYNLLLMSFAVLIVPLITVCYVHTMRSEKRRRLERELPKDYWDDNKAYIKETLDRTFHIQHYIGSMSTLTVIVMLGTAILLLLKPMPLGGNGVTGLDYSKGANFLMLGPYMELYVHNDMAYMNKLLASLTAFQFGFLGAYVYFIGHLVRSYFTLDLTPNTFVVSSVRMVTGSLLALVLSFGVQELLLVEQKIPWGKEAFSWLPVVSFFIGFFPARGLRMIEKVSLRLLNLKKQRYFSHPLSELPGMSFNHEVRLLREGYDNVENLAHADALNLALRTGFSYGQLTRWISQAQLVSHLGDDYQSCKEATGITGMIELRDYIEGLPGTDPCAALADALDPALAKKLRIVAQLVSAPAAAQP